MMPTVYTSKMIKQMIKEVTTAQKKEWKEKVKCFDWHIVVSENNIALNIYLIGETHGNHLYNIAL